MTRLDSGPLDYSVFSELPTSQTSFKLRGMNELEWGGRRSNYLERYSLISENLTALAELAKEIVEKATIRINRAEAKPEPRELTPREKAEALEFYLQLSGEYRYSLDASIQDVKKDPVEDFLFNRKTGNCEYFASALALMMRAVKIPARIVSGYKGGIERPEKRSYQFEVQQRFSHLWVEAWVDQTDPGWTTFDATPEADRLATLANLAQKKPSVWAEMQSTLSGLWSENVLNMSLDRQEQSIYKPLRELAYSLATFFRQLFTSPRSAFETLTELFKNREQWLSIGGGLFVFVLLLLTVAFVSGVRLGIRSFCAWSAKLSSRLHLQQRRIVLFYEKFAKFAELRGLKRASTETQREFAERVAMDLLSELSSARLREVPEQISQCFYRVRFGDEHLTTEDLNRLEQSLTEFEHALKNHATSQS
jgi:hypothetical protein